MSKSNSGWVRRQTSVLLAATLALSPVMAVPAMAAETDGTTVEQSQDAATDGQDVEKDAEQNAGDAAPESDEQDIEVDAAATQNSLMPMSADEGADPAPATEGVATVNGVSYDTLASALDAVPENGIETTVTLTQDVVMTTKDIVTVSEGQNVVLDMNGHSITADKSDFNGRPIINRGTLTVTGNGTIDTSMAGAGGRGSIENFGTLTIENGAYRGSLESNSANIWDRAGGTMTVNGGTFDTNGTSISTEKESSITINDGSFNSPWYPTLENNGTALITGGSFVNTSCSSCDSKHWGYTIRSGLNNESAYLRIDNATVTGTQGGVSIVGGTADIYGGKFKTVDCPQNHGAVFYALYVAGESYKTSTTIYDGTFSSEKRTALYVGNSQGDGGNEEEATVVVKGGSFTGGGESGDAVHVDNQLGALAVSGGSFSSVLSSDWLAEGFAPTELEGGKYGVANIFAGGTGTAEDPYVISNEGQLKAFRDSVNSGQTYAGKVISLTQGTYDLSESVWTPIGDGTRSGSGYTGNAFAGIFEGNDSTISGLKMDGETKSADDALGLFGVLDGATVSGLTFEGVDINVPNSECIGALAGLMTNGSTVDGVTVSGSIAAKSGVGGIVGRMTKTGTISNCVNNATVSGTGANVGGIVGAAYYTSNDGDMHITGCVNNGEVTCSAGGAAGIVGLSSAFVKDCKNTAPVTGSGSSVGGIVGEQKNYGAVTGCVNNGDVANNGKESDYGTGGIVGWVRYSGGETDYPKTEIISVTNNTNNGKVDGATVNNAGGIVGTVYNAAVVTGNENTAPSISAITFAAGIVGNLQLPTDGVFIESNSITVSNNVSTTPIEEIKGAHTDSYAYNNNPSDTSVVVGKNEGALDAWTVAVTTNGVTANYVSAEDAFSAITGETTDIKLLSDVTASVTIPEGAEVTLDLAGHTLTNTSDQHTITNNGTLTITDSVGGGTIDNVSHARGALVNYGTVTVEDGTLTRSKEAGSSPSQSGDNSWYVIDNHGTMTFNGGTVTSTGKFSSLIRNAAGTLTINDGSFSNGFIALKNELATLVVNGGTISSGEQSVQNWGTATLSGGTFNGPVATWAQNGAAGTTTIEGNTVINGDVKAVNYMGADEGPQVNITGGTITGEVSKGTHDGKSGIKPVDPSDASSDISISGGTFGKEPPAEFIVEGSGFVKDPETGEYGIVEAKLTVDAPDPVNVSKVEKVTEEQVLSLAQVSAGGYTLSVDADDLTALNEAIAAKKTGDYAVRVYATKPALEGQDAETLTATVTYRLESLHTVTLVLGNGQADTVVTVEDGQPLDRPSDPVRDGWTFAGWFATVDSEGKLSDEYDFSAPVTGDLTLYAGWYKVVDDTTPETPETPTTGNGGTTDKTGAADKDGSLAKTGDPTSVAPIAAAAAAGVAAVGAAAATRRRRRE